MRGRKGQLACRFEYRKVGYLVHFRFLVVEVLVADRIILFWPVVEVEMNLHLKFERMKIINVSHLGVFFVKMAGC